MSDSSTLTEAYRAWKSGASLRELEDRYKTSKSSLQRHFKKLQEDVGVEGLSEVAEEEASGKNQFVAADPELQEIVGEVNALRTRLQRARTIFALRKQRRELQEKTLEADAKLAAANIIDFDCEHLDLSRLSEYIEIVVHQECPALIRGFWQLTELLGMSEEDALENIFTEPFEEWADNQEADTTFRSYVRSCLADWIEVKEAALERRRERIQEEKRVAEMQARRELEEELEAFEKELRCPLYPQHRNLIRKIEKDSYSSSFSVKYRCLACQTDFPLRWIKRIDSVRPELYEPFVESLRSSLV